MPGRINTRRDAFKAIAASLRDFGYPDASAEMASDVYDAIVAGKSGADLPHDIVGRFMESQINEVREALDRLPAGT